MPGKVESIADRHWPGLGLPPGVGLPSATAAMTWVVPARGLPRWALALKRAEDVLGAWLALCLFAVPMLLIALAIRLDSPGPVLFRQHRIGLHNRGFAMLKFRTMHHAAADKLGCTQATRDDPRVTRLGAFLRRTSLDELPQLFNVLRGEMSLVGPRPHAPDTRAGRRLFAEITAHYAARHIVKPGITGLAQVRGLRGEIRTVERAKRRVELDKEYIDRWSVWLDLRIMLSTVRAVLFDADAY